MLEAGKKIRSQGGSFAYEVIGPVCRLYDREELPWPCCNLRARTKWPSWRRIGRRFVPDVAASRCPSYFVKGIDAAGVEWTQVLTEYDRRLSGEERLWWYSPRRKHEAL